jgi:hypothetical protein
VGFHRSHFCGATVFGFIAIQLIGGPRPGSPLTRLCAQESKRIHLKGVLVSGGAECPRLRATDNSYYTLEGDLHGFKVGDAVEITAEPVDRSHCMQDTTVRIITIERAKS